MIPPFLTTPIGVSVDSLPRSDVPQRAQRAQLLHAGSREGGRQTRPAVFAADGLAPCGFMTLPSGAQSGGGGAACQTGACSLCRLEGS